MELSALRTVRGGGSEEEVYSKHKRKEDKQ